MNQVRKWCKGRKLSVTRRLFFIEIQLLDFEDVLFAMDFFHFIPRHLPLEALLGRFELSTPRFVDACSIQLSYRSILGHEGIEPTRVMITADLQSAPPP